MNKDQIATMEMFLAVEKVCSEYHSLWRNHYGFRSAFHLFSGRLLYIRQIIHKMESLYVLPKKDSAIFRKRLEELTVRVSKNLLVYALTRGDHKLIDKLDYLSSDFSEITCDDLLRKSQDVLEISVEHYSELRTYFITLAHLAEMEESIEKLRFCTGGETVTIQTREKLYDKLDDLILEARKVLKEHLDAQSMMFRWVNKDFYESYKKARGIRTAYSVPLQGTVIDDATHFPVGNADITIRELKLTRHISPLGHFRFYNLPPGQYHAKVHKYGYEDSEVEVEVQKDEGTSVDILVHHI